MNRNLDFLRAATLLLFFAGNTASASFVRRRDNNDARRDLIGLNQLMDLVPIPAPTLSPTVAPTTQVPSTAPIAETDGRLEPAEETVPGAPTKYPTTPPTHFPTRFVPPTPRPTVSMAPSISTSPTAEATSEPTTSEPTQSPTDEASEVPTLSPTVTASSVPTIMPTNEPSEIMSDEPSQEPSTGEPSESQSPSDTPTTPQPSDFPSGSAEPSQFPSGSTEPSGTGTVPVEDVTAVVGRAELDEREEPKTISETICDPEKTDLWGSLCKVLKETKYFNKLKDAGSKFTLFAPTNEAFVNSDYALEELMGDRKAMKRLVAVHIATSALSYSALECSSNTEMIDLDQTFTLCVHVQSAYDTKFQSADGNDITNLPVIDQTQDQVQASNGIIHSVNNLLLPFGFKVKSSVNPVISFYEENAEKEAEAAMQKEQAAMEEEEAAIEEEEAAIEEEEAAIEEEEAAVEEEDAVIEEEVATEEEEAVTDEVEQSFIIEVDTDGSWNASNVFIDDDFEESDSGMSATDTTDDEMSSSLSSAMAGFGELRPEVLDVGCQVCESRELCAIPRSAVMLVPGEGEVPCINVVNRQNRGRGIIMGSSICQILQERFRESCLIGDDGK